MKGILRALAIGVATAMIAYVVWDRVEAYRIARDIRAIAARGEPVDLSWRDAPLPSAQHVEAAQLYAEAAARAAEMVQQDGRLTRYDVDAVVAPVSPATIEAAFRTDAPALQLLDRATTLPFAGFGDVEGGENVAGLIALTGLSALRADLLAVHGKGDEAVASLVAAIRVQRTFSSLFSRNALSQRVLGSLRILLRHATPSVASLETLQRAFTDLPDEDGLARDLIRFRAVLIEDGGAMGVGPLPAGMPTVLHPFMLRLRRIQIEQFPDVIAAARGPWPDKIGTLAAMSDGARRPYSAERSVFGPLFSADPPSVAATGAIVTQAGLNLAMRGVAIATMAVERYRRAHDGAPPPSLAALTPSFIQAVPLDPFTGQALAYKADADRYLVYSADVNRKDDGGAFYGIGSLTAESFPRVRDYGITVSLTRGPGRQ